MSTDNETSVRYRLVEPDNFDPKDQGHTQLIGDEYVAATSEKLDLLEEHGTIEVLDWEHGAGEEITFTGPPEPINDGDTEKLVYVDESTGDVKTTKIGSWVCERHDTGSVIETGVTNGEIQVPHECPDCERQGPFHHKGLEDYPNISPSAFANPQWYTPTGISDEQYGKIWSDIRDWIHENWATSDEHLYEGLTAFAISTWLRPNLNFLTQLLVLGKHETGKTRLLTTLARVSYRGMVPVSFTSAAMFRTIDTYNITLFLSEYHDLNKDRKDEVNAVIKGSQKRGENVIRASEGQQGFEPANFDIFTHVGIGAQFEPPDDIISRAIEINTEPADRKIPTWFDEEQAAELRNRLLYARYRLLDSNEWDKAETDALDWLNQKGINGRLREKLLSLVTVAVLWDKRNDIEKFVDAMVDRAQEAKEESDDALVIRAIRDLAFEELREKQTIDDDADPWNGLTIPLSDVTDRFNDITGRDVNATYIGQVRNRLGIEKVRRSDGTVIKDDELAEKLQDLCEQNNLEWDHSGWETEIKELEDHSHGICELCGENGTLSHRNVVDNVFMCNQCANEGL